ncbi:MAG: beta-ketoacyl-[acyl-carrier-protein] synthase family protein [Oligoflexales bacterium]|nr:beta-ketoacyl-[acyl-carrier-protein] synthase family protein [Oligoflexales bacterium]
MKNAKRVVVTGMGIVAPNAHGLAEYADALYQGVSGIRRIERLRELDFACNVGGVPESVLSLCCDYFNENELSGMNEGITYGLIAAIDAFRDAGFMIPAMGDDFVYEDTGAVIGTGIGGMDTFGNVVCPRVAGGKIRRLGSTIVEKVMASGVSAKVGGKLALGNQVTTNSSACGTGCESIIMGAERIKFGLAKRMIVGGAEGSDPFIWCGFDAMKVLCRRYNDTPQAASRPMSASAAGFVPGSGAGILVLEELETALERGARIYAEILGGFICSGGMRHGGSMTAPSPMGVQRCIRGAVMDAGIKPHEIDYINGHLTATMADTMELLNWSKALGTNPSDFPMVNSTKSMIGHGLGASGAMESVATILQMDRGFVHKSLNCEDLHPDLEQFAGSIPHESITRDIKIAAKASFGFGDVNSCLILAKWRH